MLFIVRLFPEITIKSPSVRKRWTRILTDNLRVLGRRIHDKTVVEQDWDRILVNVKNADDNQKAALETRFTAMLASTPGIANFSKVSEHHFDKMEDLYPLAFAAWQGVVAGKTFCVRARRSGKHGFTSTDVERYVGGGINQNTDALGVKLKDPDVTLSLEIKQDKCYLVEQKHEGLGGFPLGTQDGVLSLVSGGFDSTVASYLMMQRGMRTHYCFFNMGGRDHELGVKELSYFLWNKYSSSHRVRFITVPFEGVVAEILEKIDASHMGVVLKRMMFRAAEKLAEKGGLQAFVTGEAIAQVSSQTITNLSAIDKVTDMLVLRPLITMGKPEIIRLSRQIGTEDFSANIPEYCGVISVKPSASVKMEKLLMQEEHFDFSVLDRALDDCVVQPIDEVMNDVTSRPEVLAPIEVLEPGDCVIDIRHPDEKEQKPLAVAACDVLDIPFYQLNSRMAALDQAKRYLLYCDRGVMSQLHATHLRDDGYTNIGVFRPE